MADRASHILQETPNADADMVMTVSIDVEVIKVPALHIERDLHDLSCTAWTGMEDTMVRRRTIPADNFQPCAFLRQTPGV
jgi:hypothetical protein